MKKNKEFSNDFYKAPIEKPESKKLLNKQLLKNSFTFL